MADASFDAVLANWINNHTWPSKDTPNHAILVVTAASGPAFVFSSSFSYFQIAATYDKITNSLHDIEIYLEAPTNPNSVAVAAVDSYPLSTSDGKRIAFDLGEGYVTGKVSFKYSEDNHILATYAANLPFAGELEGTIDISPTDPNEVAELKLGALQSLQSVEVYKSKRTLTRTHVVDNNEQALFVKYLKDFTVGPQQLAVVTYYEGHSLAYEIVLPFFRFFEIALTIDNKSLAASVALYVVLPFPIGRVKLLGSAGGLINGIELGFGVLIAHGKIKLWVEKQSNGKHTLYADGSGWVAIHGNWNFGKTKLIDLPL